jgi:hypothetical protein
MGAVLIFDAQAVAEAEDRDRSRTFSLAQMTANVLSLADLGGEADTAQADTRRWRTEWWDTITAYTLGGQYFWGGKGFGINLADDDGFQTVGLDDGIPQLRSPHNAHLTMLARSGVPGVVLWLLLHLAFAASLIRAYFQARRRGWHDRARVNLWLLAYWIAFIVNASFDVALEGPYGGIWFWCIVGAGLAAMRSQQVSERAWRLGIAPR